MSLSQSCSAEAKVLRGSPAFSMSLGSKELFHTNFLAFLLEADDSALQPVQLELRRALAFPPGAGCALPCAVWREKSNLDLVVVELRPAGPGDVDFEQEAAEDPGDASDDAMPELGWDWNAESGWQRVGSKSPAAAPGAAGGTASAVPRFAPSGRVLVVEAKLKSVPRLEQLLAYDDFIANTGLTLRYPEDGAPSWRLRIQHQPIERCLLTISGVTMQTPATAARAHSCLWHGVSWSQLQKAMAGSLVAIAGSPFHSTLTDYVGMLGALVEMARQAVHLCDDAQRSRVPYGAMRAQVLDASIKTLRLRDLLGKTLFDHWLQGHLLPKLSAALGGLLPAGWRFDAYTHYTRDTPGLGVELINAAFVSSVANGPSDLRLGVQIQGAEFRLFASVERPYPGLEAWIACHPILLLKWHQMPLFRGVSPIGLSGRPVLPPTASGRATNLKRFGLSRFLYSKCDIDDRPVDEVVDEVVRVMAAALPLLPHL